MIDERDAPPRRDDRGFIAACSPSPLRGHRGHGMKQGIAGLLLCMAFLAFAASPRAAEKTGKAADEAAQASVEMSPSALSAEVQEAIDKNSQLVRSRMPEVAGIPFEYDEASVEWLDGYINRMRDEFGDEPGRLSQVLASYIGESIRRKYGGRWVDVDGSIGVEIRTDFIVFPFNKVDKQFENGPEDSALSFYRSIPVLLDHASTAAPSSP